MICLAVSAAFALAARRTGFQTIQFCEIEPFPQAVLRKNFPGVPIHADITTFDGKPFRGRVTLLTGGFPCQDISAAGKGAGLIEGKRSSLWFDALRVIGECRPAVLLIENVPRLRTLGADRVLQDLAEAGYTAAAFVVGADDVGASHRRKRVWIVAFRMEDAGYCRRRAEGPPAAGDHEAGGWEQDSGTASVTGATLADTYRTRQPQPGRAFANVGGWDQYGGESVADANRSGRFQRGGTEPGGEELSSSECGGEAVADAEEAVRELAGDSRARGSGDPDHGSAMADAESEQTGGILLSAVSARVGRNCPPVMADTDSLAEWKPEHEALPGGNQRDTWTETRISCRRMGQFPPGPGADWSGIPAEFWPVEQAESEVRMLASGVPANVVRRRRDAGKRAAILKGLGNAIVPQVAEMFMRWIAAQLREESTP